MAVDERRRNALFRAAADVLGEEHAVTMFELFPPPSTDLATQQGVDHGFELMDRRFEAIDQRFEAIDKRFEEQRHVIETRLDDRIDALRDELLAAFRQELVGAVAGQTRAVILAVVTTTLAIATMAVMFAQLL